MKKFWFLVACLSLLCGCTDTPNTTTKQELAVEKASAPTVEFPVVERWWEKER